MLDGEKRGTRSTCGQITTEGARREQGVSEGNTGRWRRAEEKAAWRMSAHAPMLSSVSAISRTSSDGCFKLCSSWRAIEREEEAFGITDIHTLFASADNSRDAENRKLVDVGSVFLIFTRPTFAKIKLNKRCDFYDEIYDTLFSIEIILALFNKAQNETWYNFILYIYNIIIVELQFQRYNLFRVLRCESNSARLKLVIFSMITITNRGKSREARFLFHNNRCDVAFLPIDSPGERERKRKK